MNILDSQTVLFSYGITSTICVVVMIFLWQQNRKRFMGMGFWLVVFVMQFLAVLLFALHGIAPDFVSIVIPNTLVVGGTILLYMGLERYVGKTSLQYHNYLVLVVFICVHTYFTYVHPSQVFRNLNSSLSLLFICLQCAWLMLHRVEGAIKSETSLVGVGFTIYCLALVGRVSVVLTVPASDNLIKSGLFDTLALLIYQLVLVALTFGLFLMVNRRLFATLEGDIAVRKEIEQTLKESEARLLQAQAVAHVGSWEIDLVTNLMWGSAEAFRIYGLERTSPYMPLAQVQRIPIVEDRPRLDAALRALLQGQGAYDLEFRIKRSNEEAPRVIHSVAHLVCDAHSAPIKVAGVIQDITERKHVEEMLMHQSTHDTLTGLYNRQHYENEILQLQMSRLFPITILMMDVDGLKRVNDSQGHHVGDDLLRRVAQVLKNTFRPDDLVARVGGDEFVVVLPNTNDITAVQVVQRLKNNLKKHNQEHLPEQELILSIGKASGDQSSLLSEVFKQADRDMYRDKAENKT